MGIVLVSSDEALAFEGVRRVAELAAALQLPPEEVEGLLLDLRDGDDASALDVLGEPEFPCVAVVASVTPEVSEAAKTGVRVLPSAWAGDDLGGALAVLEREIEVAVSAVELRQLRERQAQLVQNEKFAAVGLLAAEIAHEINNPATFVITNLNVMIDYVATIGAFHTELRELLRAGGELDLAAMRELEERHEIRFLDEDLDALLDRSLAGLNRIHQIVHDLRYFGSDRERESNWVDLDALVNAALNLVRHEARFRTTLVADLPRLPGIRSDANRVGQVILNLLVNAVQSIAPGAADQNRVEVTAEIADDEVILVVTDTGSGMQPEVLERIFEPFYTTKALGEGSGLGLAISHDIMRSLGGDILASSTPGAGSRFEVHIPRDAARDD